MSFLVGFGIHSAEPSTPRLKWARRCSPPRCLREQARWYIAPPRPMRTAPEIPPRSGSPGRGFSFVLREGTPDAAQRQLSLARRTSRICTLYRLDLGEIESLAGQVCKSASPADRQQTAPPKGPNRQQSEGVKNRSVFDTPKNSFLSPLRRGHSAPPFLIPFRTGPVGAPLSPQAHLRGRRPAAPGRRRWPRT